MKTYRYSEYFLMIYPDVNNNYFVRFPSIIRRFNHQLLLNEDNIFFTNYWVIGSYIDRCFLRTGYVTRNELLEFWEKQTDKDEKLTEIFWNFINSQ